MSQKKKNKDFDIDKYREGIVTSLTVLKSDVGHSREKLIELTSLLREQNHRIRKNEKSIARIFGMGSVIMGTFSALIAWLFKK
jgi:uncharacterized membrane protein